MALAFVLINCDLGAEEDIIEQLKHIDGVTETHGVFGAYDIITRIEASETEKLREIITWSVRKISKIRSSLTLMEIEEQK